MHCAVLALLTGIIIWHLLYSLWWQLIPVLPVRPDSQPAADPHQTSRLQQKGSQGHNGTPRPHHNTSHQLVDLCNDEHEMVYAAIAMTLQECLASQHH
jgi:hypothetical protein